LIGLVLPDSGNRLFGELAQAVEQAAAQRDYALVITSNVEGSVERQNLERLASFGLEVTHVERWCARHRRKCTQD
jgi:DNA-binding LacI/PurR family transcriptional regulator